MDERKARLNIPDTWGTQARCPQCGSPGMRLLHIPGAPDQLTCTTCGIGFELALKSASIHVRTWPEELAILRTDVADRWITVAELKALARLVAAQKKGTASTQATPKTPAPTPGVAAGVTQRVENLFKLGNTPAQIRAILQQGESDPQRLEAGLQAVSILERQENQHQQIKLRNSLVVIGLTVVVLVAAGFIYQRTHLPGTVGSGEVSPLIATQVPNLAKVLHLSTPVVEHNVLSSSSASNTASTCPRDAGEAATVFGGQAANWSSPPGSNGWMMLTTGQADIINVPANMTAAYLELGNAIKMVTVDGPVTLHNISYVAISCP